MFPWQFVIQYQILWPCSRKSLQPQSQQLESDQAADPQFEIAPNDEDEEQMWICVQRCMV